jgi:hypothetical protein
LFVSERPPHAPTSLTCCYQPFRLFSLLSYRSHHACCLAVHHTFEPRIHFFHSVYPFQSFYTRPLNVFNLNLYVYQTQRINVDLLCLRLYSNKLVVIDQPDWRVPSCAVVCYCFGTCSRRLSQNPFSLYRFPHSSPCLHAYDMKSSPTI